MPSVITYQLIKGQSWAVPRFYILAPIFAFFGVMWVLRMGHGQRRTLWIGRVGVGLLVIGTLTGSWFLSDRDYTYAEGEFAFFGPLLGAAAFTWLAEALARGTDYWRAALGGLILLLVLGFPMGIGGALARAMRKRGPA